MTPWLQTLAAVAMASILPLAATMTLAGHPRVLGVWIPRLIPFAVGSLVGAAVFHLIPEAFSRSSHPTSVVGMIALGLMTFVVVDRVLHRQFAAAPTELLGAQGVTVSAIHSQPSETLRKRTRELLPLNIAGDALHNFIDGILIASSFLDDPALGIITGAAIALHELPRELGTFALCIQGGLSVAQAVRLNAATALVSLLGAALTLGVGAKAAAFGGHFLPFAAGNLLYLAGSILAAELRGAKSRREVARIVALIGCGLIITALAARH